MKRILSIVCILALCLSLCACSASWEPPKKAEASLSDAMNIKEAAQATTGAESALVDTAGKQQAAIPGTGKLYKGDTFTLSIREFNDRLSTIAAKLCPGMTVHLLADDWSAVTELRYNGEPFCQLTYYSTDDYLDTPYPHSAMNDKMLDARKIRYVNVLDYLSEPHPENSFLAIAMTFDPTITAAQAEEIAQFLKDNHSQYWGTYLVTSCNGIGYGYAHPVNQMEYSGSICIRAGVSNVKLCQHALEYTRNSAGQTVGQCTKCGQYVFSEDSGVSITGMTVSKHSNDSSGKDVQVGEWKDPAGNSYRDALKFWVIKREGFTNTEYIEYKLDDDYTTLSGIIAPSDESAEKAKMKIEIYVDSKCVYVSETIGYNSQVPYSLDISGARIVRIRCVTDTNAWGHCIVTANLS